MTEAENARAVAKREVADTAWIDDVLVWSHAMRPSPPVYMMPEIKKHSEWACDDFVLRLAREKHGVFTSTAFAVAGSTHQCQAEDFDYVHEPLGVMACLKHMVVHQCVASWQQVGQWIDLPNNGSSLHCRRILVGGRNETNWCCAFSRKRLPDADVLDMTSAPVKSLYDLADKVYGSRGSLERQGPGVRTTVGGSLKSRKRTFEEAFHSGIKNSALLREAIDNVVEVLADASKRAKYNEIVGHQSGERKVFLKLEPVTQGLQFVLKVRLMELCERLLEEMKGGKVDLNSLVFIALRVTIEGPQSGNDVAVPRLPVRSLKPLPMETVFTTAFGISPSQYSKTFKRIQLLISDSRFTRHMGWCVESNNGASATKCRESKSVSSSCSPSSCCTSPSSSSSS